MTAEQCFGAAVRHRDFACMRDGFRFETFIHREAEHEGVAGGEAAFQLREDGRQALVAQGLVQQPCVVAFLRRFAGELLMT